MRPKLTPKKNLEKLFTKSNAYPPKKYSNYKSNLSQSNNHKKSFNNNSSGINSNIQELKNFDFQKVLEQTAREKENYPSQRMMISTQNSPKQVPFRSKKRQGVKYKVVDLGEN